MADFPDNYPRAALDVLRERHRQISQEGWTPEHDDTHVAGELAMAAVVYAATHPIQLVEPHGDDGMLDPWPWFEEGDVSGGRGETPIIRWVRAWHKPTDRRRDLIKAAALIIAEIERIDRSQDRTEHLL